MGKGDSLDLIMVPLAIFAGLTIGVYLHEPVEFERFMSKQFFHTEAKQASAAEARKSEPKIVSHKPGQMMVGSKLVLRYR